MNDPKPADDAPPPEIRGGNRPADYIEGYMSDFVIYDEMAEGGEDDEGSAGE